MTIAGKVNSYDVRKNTVSIVHDFVIAARVDFPSSPK